jgi:clathrin heavy chain
MFTELGVLYAKYKVEKLLEHCKVFWARLNISKLIRVCEVGEHWAVQCFLYEKFDEYDNAVMCMINHVAEAFDHSMFKELLAKGSNIEIAHKAIDFYITYSPLELNDMLVFLAGRLDPLRVVAQIQRTDNLSLIKAYMQQVQQLNLPKLNEALNDLYIEEGDYERIRQSVDMYANFDLISLAKRLEGHECLEFRRVATHLFKKAQQWELAVTLAKKDKLYKDAISTAATSQDPMLVDSLLTFFVEEKEKECFAASLFMCYDYVHPDVVMELAWRNDIMDFAMPYFIQVMGEFKTMRHQLKEMAVALTALMTGGAPMMPPQQQQQPPQPQVQQPPQQQAPPQQEAAGGFGFISS